MTSNLNNKSQRLIKRIIRLLREFRKTIRICKKLSNYHPKDSAQKADKTWIKTKANKKSPNSKSINLEDQNPKIKILSQKIRSKLQNKKLSKRRPLQTRKTRKTIKETSQNLQMIFKLITILIKTRKTVRVMMTHLILRSNQNFPRPDQILLEK